MFAAANRSYGLATVRYPALEIEARVEPYEGRGFRLRVLRAGKPREVVLHEHLPFPDQVRTPQAA